MRPRILGTLFLATVVVGVDASERYERSPGGCGPGYTWSPDNRACIYTPETRRRPRTVAGQVKQVLNLVFAEEIKRYAELRDYLENESEAPFKHVLALHKQLGGAIELERHLFDARNKDAFERQTGLLAFIAEREAMRQKKELDEKLAEQKKQAQEKPDAHVDSRPPLAACEDYPAYPGCDKVLADAGKPVQERPKVKPWPGPGARPPLQICEDYPVYAGCDTVLAEAQEQQKKKDEAEAERVKAQRQEIEQHNNAAIVSADVHAIRNRPFQMRIKTRPTKLRGLVLVYASGEEASFAFDESTQSWLVNVKPISTSTVFRVYPRGPDPKDSAKTVAYGHLKDVIVNPAPGPAPVIHSIDPTDGRLLSFGIRVRGQNFDDIQQVRISGGQSLAYRIISSSEMIVTIGEPGWGSSLDDVLQITNGSGSTARKDLISPSGPVTKNRLGNPEYCFPAVGQACYGAGKDAASEKGWGEQALKSIKRIGCSAEVNGERNCWVIPGSIKHDNCCLIYPGGKWCGGPGTDGKKAEESNHNGQCVAEWDAAVWDGFWNRAWSATFNTREPADLTPVPSTRVPIGREVVASVGHCAPDRHELREQADQAFCCSGRAVNKVCQGSGRTVQRVAHLGNPLAGPPPAPGEIVSRPTVADAARKAEEERKAEAARKAAEEERTRQELAKREAERVRLAEEARNAEEQRKAQEAARKVEEERKAQEAARKAAEEERARQELAKREAERVRLAEEARNAEEARKAQEAARKAEEERLAARKPQGQLQPDKVYPGDLVTFSGHDFAPNLSLVVFMPGQPLNPGETRTTVGADGRVANWSFHVPAGTKPGTYSVVLGRVEEILVGGRADAPFGRNELKLALTVLEPKKPLEPELKNDVADQKFCNPNLPRLWQPGCVDKPVADKPKTDVAEPVKPKVYVVQPVKPKQEQAGSKPCDPNLPRLWQPGCIDKPAADKPKTDVAEPAKPPVKPSSDQVVSKICNPNVSRLWQPGCIDAPAQPSAPAGESRSSMPQSKPAAVPTSATPPTPATKPSIAPPPAAPARSAPRCNPNIPLYNQPGCVP